jgi:hypothetical protein
LCAACRARMAAGERRNVITVVFAHIVWALDRSERLDPESVRWAVQRWFERGGRGWLGGALRTRWRDDGGWWTCRMGLGRCQRTEMSRFGSS